MLHEHILICGHANYIKLCTGPALVLACGSLMELRMRVLSSALLASAFEMSTLRPWPQHCFASTP